NTVISGARVTFASANSGIASVDATGLVTSRRNGLTRVAVTSNDVTDSITVRVAQQPARLEVIQDTVTFTALNAVQRVPVRLLDSLGNTIDGSPISVTSSFPAMIAVTTDGSLKALQVGATTLTVRSAVDSAR